MPISDRRLHLLRPRVAKLDRVSMRFRSTEIISLSVVDPDFFQKLADVLRIDVLGHGAFAQEMGDLVDRLEQCEVYLIAFNVFKESSIDLDYVHRQVSHVTQR
jgi:hypothetical protein